MKIHQNPSMLTNVFKLQISPMRCPSKSNGPTPKCLKYQNVPYIRNFWHIRRPRNRFQWWVRIIYFLTVPDDHTVVLRQKYERNISPCDKHSPNSGKLLLIHLILEIKKSSQRCLSFGEIHNSRYLMQKSTKIAKKNLAG